MNPPCLIIKGEALQLHLLSCSSSIFLARVEQQEGQCCTCEQNYGDIDKALHAAVWSVRLSVIFTYFCLHLMTFATFVAAVR